MAKKLNTLDLLQVACSGDVEKVLGYLSSTECPDNGGTSINGTYEGMTALYLAVEKDHVLAVRTLVCAGADINLECIGETPLITAVKRNRVACAHELIKLGADISCKDRDGKSALIAASCGRKDCLRLLLEVPFKNVDCEKRAALELAATKGQEECLKLLLEAGTDVNVGSHIMKTHENEENLGPTALMYAAQRREINCLKLLIQAGADVKVKTSDGETALHWAVKGGCYYRSENVLNASECGRILIESGADVNVKTSRGETPLFLALKSVENDKDCSIVTRVVKLLVDYGADVNLQTSDGETVLMWAARLATVLDSVDQYAMALLTKIIIDGSIAIGAMQPCEGKRELAAKIKKDLESREKDSAAVAECMRVLIGRRADVNMSTSSGETALMWAVKWAHQCLEINHTTVTQCVTILIESGADVNAKTVDGETALILAVKWVPRNEVKTYPAVTECVKILLDNKADMTACHKGMTVLMHAARNDNLVHLLPILVTAGAVIDQQDSMGVAALSHAVFAGSHKCVRWLIDHGASLNICDHSGKTPLHHLQPLTGETSKEEEDSERCLYVLLQEQADVNATDNDGKTPLMNVVQKFEGTKAMAMLADHGAKINLMDNRRQTALLYCLAHSKFESIHSHHEICGSVPTLLVNRIRNIITLLMDKGASFSIGRLREDQVKNLAIIDPEFDLLKLPADTDTSKRVDLEVPWNTLLSVIENDHRRMFLFLVINGGMAAQPSLKHKNQWSDSPDYVTCVWEKISKMRNLGIMKYLLATCYLLSSDLTFIFSNKPEVATAMKIFRSQPWPLVKLCFVVVSTAFGASPGRHERVKNSQLPPKLQRMLLFQEPWSRLCVHQWGKIRFTFCPEKYEKLPKPRPLLYHWPIGRTLVPCDCGKCSGTMFKYEVQEEDNESDEDWN